MLGIGMGESAIAQETQLEEITVTGSRIVRRDFESNSPIVTVDENLFDQTGTASLETQLNKLPQFTATLDNPTQGGDIQPTAQNTPGAATVSLRGIGANRNLVLLDGRRATPANASMAVDINSIPSAAISRVEIISGGASSTYGADAMAGVVNFILKKDFEGFEIDVQSGVSEEGDNFEYQVSGILGTDFADGRGNISIAFSTSERDDALQRDRKAYRNLWADSSIGGTQFFAPFSGFSTGFGNLPDAGVLNSVIDGATFTGNPLNTNIYTDFSGNAFSGTDVGGVPGVAGANFIDGQRYTLLDNGQIGTNNTDNYLILPLQRYNMYSRGNYEINDWVGVFAQGYFSKVNTTTVQEPSPITGGWGVNIDPTINRSVIPAEMLTILDSRPDPDAEFALRGLLPVNRGSETDVYTYNFTVGLEGMIPGTDWTWEAFVSQGESETTVLQTGFASLQRFREVITGPDFGTGFSQQGNASFGGFGAATATCTSGLNPFDWESVTQDCIDAIQADIKTKAVMEQTVWEANLQGGIADLPAGELRGAIGASYRENKYEFQNDTLTSQGTSFIEQALGLYPAGSSAGTIEAKEGYAELLVPVIADMPYIQQFNLELGGRISDYNTTGSSWTYKVLGDWQVNDRVRFRGGFNRAERAPNIAELFLAPEQTFAVAAGGDVCSTANGQAWSANADVNSDWQSVVALCGLLMEASGDPTADSQYYGISYQDVIAGTDPTNPQGAGAAFVFPTLQGNSTLSPETADTWTVGAVIDSPFDMDALADLRLTIDYYYIEISDAIGAQSVDIAQRQCFDTAFNPGYDINSPYCAGIARNQTGTLGNVSRTFFNNGRFETSGIDFQINWGMDIGPGRVTLSSLISYLIDMKSAELDVLPLTEYAGTLGPSENGLNGSNYDYKVLTTVGYNYDALYLGIQWRHLPSVDSATAAVVPDTTITGASSYNLFNLQGSYALMDNINLRFGIENLFNKRPPLVNRNSAPVGANLHGGGFDTNTYDTIGRRFYLGATFNY
jgi:outer membrane receptor protein involved in Fe transport